MGSEMCIRDSVDLVRHLERLGAVGCGVLRRLESRLEARDSRLLERLVSRCTYLGAGDHDLDLATEGSGELEEAFDDLLGEREAVVLRKGVEEVLGDLVHAAFLAREEVVNSLGADAGGEGRVRKEVTELSRILVTALQDSIETLELALDLGESLVALREGRDVRGSRVLAWSVKKTRTCDTLELARGLDLSLIHI